MCSVMLCSGMCCSVMLCHALFCPVILCSVVFVEGARRDEAGLPGILGDHRDNLGSGGRGMQGGGVAGGSVLRNLTTPTCRVGKKSFDPWEASPSSSSSSSGISPHHPYSNPHVLSTLLPSSPTTYDPATYDPPPLILSYLLLTSLLSPTPFVSWASGLPGWTDGGGDGVSDFGGEQCLLESWWGLVAFDSLEV